MPSFIHGKNTAVYVDEFDLTTYFNSSDLAISNDTAETTTYAATNKSFVVGLRTGTLSLSGLWSATTDGSDEELQALLGNATTPLVTVREGAAAIGSKAILAQANELNYSISSPLGDVAAISADFECSTNGTSNVTYALAQGVQLTLGASIAHGSLGALASVDNAASSANGGMGIVHVPTNTENGTTTIKIQHSADDSSWADLISFTAVGATAKTSQLSAVTGTVNRYLRVTAAGAGSSGAITFMVSFARF
tara:strand:- start:1615 stop:2367 length:753 start_codon:yes stop_codon:yes gene_type:complete